jgi:hypothetical protein
VGNVPNGYHYCQNHNQYCNHAPSNDSRYNGGYYNNNGGYYNNNGQYQGGRYDNNGQYQGGRYDNNGQYQGGRYDNNGQRVRRNNNARRNNNNNYRGQTAPAGHYYCQTHDSFCSH